jgi:hypothetical protein
MNEPSKEELHEQRSRDVGMRVKFLFSIKERLTAIAKEMEADGQSNKAGEHVHAAIDDVDSQMMRIKAML